MGSHSPIIEAAIWRERAGVSLWGRGISALAIRWENAIMEVPELLPVLGTGLERGVLEPPSLRKALDNESSRLGAAIARIS